MSWGEKVIFEDTLAPAIFQRELSNSYAHDVFIDITGIEPWEFLEWLVAVWILKSCWSEYGSMNF